MRDQHEQLHMNGHLDNTPFEDWLRDVSLAPIPDDERTVDTDHEREEE